MAPIGEKQNIVLMVVKQGCRTMVGDKIDGLRWEGIETNQWRKVNGAYLRMKIWKNYQLISNSQWSHLSVIRTGFAIHLMEPQLSKGSGLKIILSKMGLTADDLLCVGDAPNDLSMFEFLDGQLQ